MMKLLIVVPCFNEESVLRDSCGRLLGILNAMKQERQVSADSGILFVDDGSTDRTWAIIRELHDAHPGEVSALRLAANRGHQSALFAGLMDARKRADITISIDADLQDDIQVIPEMVRKAEAGADIVFGVRSDRSSDSWCKRFFAELFYRLMRMMGVRTISNHADFRLMSRRALDMLACYGEHNLYLRGLIPQIGLPHTTVDDHIGERFAGKSKYTVGKMLSLALNGITAFSVKPLYAIFNIGLLFLIIAFGIGVYVTYALIMGVAVKGWASLMLSIWLVGGFVLISMGIIGTYIGKIFTEVKQRPLYHIQDIL